MLTVTIFVGKSFSGAEEISDYEMPALPRIGETVTVEKNREIHRAEVLDVEHVIGFDLSTKKQTTLVRILVGD